VALAQELIEVLACPKCKGAVELRGDGTAFSCASCRLVYPVVDDIPNFIIEEALPLDAEPRR